MWCLTRANGTRTFHATEEGADAARDASEGVVWWDSFDYARYNVGRAA